ncbi:hypothetical protein DFH08DRAFT_1089296 [Mycena albidolilacea]|uniref:Uncharacterized protein n=1 Tax=Mycena albidolilacea TaxID=1033008 RepID=A0AAD6Z242_9AGAR|nr:hypothetical protein DFH08DRAFT_1089296 [Mycena albidolilacea]
MQVKTSTIRRFRPQDSRIGHAFFTHGFALVAGILARTYLISLADLWLHAAATVVLLPR